MSQFTPPLEDFSFLFGEYLENGPLAGMKGRESVSGDILAQILTEAGKLASDVLYPLNASGDLEGCVYENGVVRTPKGYDEAYKLFTESGWGALTARTEDGGQNLPHCIGTAVSEMVISANMAFGTYPGLTAGAYEALLRYGNDAIKAQFLPPMIEGRWSGAMCLTEPHSGTDLGLIRTKAVEGSDSESNSFGQAWRISGTKIFITGGEQDLTENIIYLTLARLPNAPAGVKGISLFLVPKYLVNDQGKMGARNGVSCGSIEHKMGLKGSSTCTMNFDQAVGYLVGEPNQGMRAMFTMMNAARLGVATQGTAICEMASQRALGYAIERRQGRALNGAESPNQEADSILVHPDVRRMILTMQSHAEGTRALGLEIAVALDRASHDEDPQVRQDAEDFVALMTPIAKAMFTDFGLDSANMAVQVFGGHGYIRENGVEQLVRDIRIALLYEGTNGVQALDLVGRKLPQNGGRLLRSFFHPLTDFLSQQEKALSQAKPNDYSKAFGQHLQAMSRAVLELQQATMLIAAKGLGNPDEAAAMSSEFLRQFGLVALGWVWLRQELLAMKALTERGGQSSDDGLLPRRKEFYQKKLQMANFYFARMLPDAGACYRKLQSGAAPLAVDLLPAA